MRYHVLVIAIFLNLNLVCKSQNLDSALVDYFENELSLKLTPGNRFTEVKTKHRNRVTLFVSDFQIPFSLYQSFFRNISTLEDSFYSIITDFGLSSDTIFIHKRHIDSLERIDTFYASREPVIANTNPSNKNVGGKLIFYGKRIQENVYVFYNGPEKVGYLPYTPIMGRVHYFLVYKAHSCWKYLYKPIDFN